MFHQSVLLATIVILQVALSLPVNEKINPVELKYNCVRVLEADGKVDDKTPILLIHGLARSLKEWDDVKLLLSVLTKRRACAVDLRNHGDSPWDKRTDVEAQAVDIGHFLDNQGIQKVNIIGHSLGGKVAIHYTLNNPDRVNSIIVEDMRPNGITKDAFNQVKLLFNVLKEALDNVPAGVTEEEARNIILNFLNEKMKQMGIPKQYTSKSLDFLQLKLVDEQWRAKNNMDAILEAVKDPESILGKSSGEYKGPALFIYGDQSPYKVNEDKDNILKLFPRAKLVPVEGAGHKIHGDFPKFNDEVVKFLNKVN